jgi:anti-sigma regulatory factor (Ser/Thr protein kinase)
MRHGATSSSAARLEHPALIYRDLGELVGALAPFVRRGVERREPTFVAVGPAELAALRGAVGDHDGLHWRDTNAWHPRPATRLRAFHTFVADHLSAGRSRIRFVDEPLWPAGGDELTREWARYESVLNAVLAPFPATLVCTYDASRLDPEIVEGARRTHPILGLDGRSRPSPAFEDPSTLVARWNVPLRPPPASAQRMRPPIDPANARAFVAERAARAGLSPGRRFDLQLAVTELLANALVHGGGKATVRVWVATGYLHCQVDDEGPGIADALAGYRPPGAAAGDGRGLWLARQVVDLLQIDSTAKGAAVRVRLRLP